MIKRALPLILLTLAGCQTTRTLVVPCIGKDQTIPAEPDAVKGKLTGRADEDTRTLAGGLLRWQSYGRTMRQIVESCRQ